MKSKRTEKRFLIGVVGLFIILLPCIGQAEIPSKINYQGYLTSASGVPVNGTVAIVFTFYTVDTGGSSIWSETQNVTVNNGVYNVNLGDVTPITSLPFGLPYYLGVKVGTDPAMVPRIPLTSVGYAFRAKTVDSVSSHTHSGADITSGVVPIGAVIDWWRPDATFAVPSGFAICDGSVVNDAVSPLNGKTLPNLTNRFIMGVTNVNNIGTSGGSDTHGHTVDINHGHGAVNTSSGGSFTGNTGWDPGHRHKWIYQQLNPDGKKLWMSWPSEGPETIMYIWDNGINNEGEGIYPIANAGHGGNWFTETYGAHLHQFSVGSHFHSVDVAALGVVNKNTTTVSNVPSYYGLLKIMRIK